MMKCSNLKKSKRKTIHKLSIYQSIIEQVTEIDKINNALTVTKIIVQAVPVI